jgi:hypothetical protein
MARREFDAIKVKDQLGKPDNIGIFGPFKKTETLVIEEGPTIVTQANVTGVAIWDNPSSTWDGTDLDDLWGPVTIEGFILNSGQQGIMGENILGLPSGEFITKAITNFNNEFVERFVFDNLKGASTTATWDTTNKQATFTAGQVLTIVSAFKDTIDETQVSSATLSVTSTSGVFNYEMSANGGVNWETVTLSEEYTFVNRGHDLRIRVTEDDSSTGTVTLIRCRYNI